MEQSPFGEANSHSTSQEIPSLLWNPKANCRVHTRACHWSLSWARWIQSTLSYLISLGSIVI